MANMKGAKPDKLMRNALLLELHQDGSLSDGQKVKKLRLVAEALVREAIAGDIAAIKEINERIDGKITQGHAGEDGEGAIKLEIGWLSKGS